MKRISWRYFDFLLLGAVALLTILGVTMIRSAIAGNIELVELNVVRRQIIFALVGLVIILFAAAFDYRLLSSFSRVAYIGMTVLLAVLFIIGAAFFGSARWFDVGIFLIQPSELAKIVIILVMAEFFSRNQHKLGDVQWVLRSFALTFLMTIWILLQPDLSTSIVIFVIWFSMLWASGLRIKHIALGAGLGAAGLAIGIPILLLNYVPGQDTALLKSYQIDRIINFIFPDQDSTFGAIYNVQQALISIGSGGWFGQGYGSGSQTQLRFLKVRHSDFIFSAFTEEFGFFGALVLMALVVFVIWRCIRAARLASDTFGALIAHGVATLITFQAVVNIGMNLNLLPVTGLVLPFVSYGGSSLLSMALGIGLVESVVLRQKSLDF